MHMVYARCPAKRGQSYILSGLFYFIYLIFLTIAVKIPDSVAHEKEKAMQGVKSVSKPQPGYDRDYFYFLPSFL